MLLILFVAFGFLVCGCIVGGFGFCAIAVGGFGRWLICCMDC